MARLAAALNIWDVPLTVISDRCKGLSDAVAETLPMAAHSFCAFHIHQNVVQRFGKAAAAHVWNIANASTEREFATAVEALGNVSPGARDYLAGIPRDQWVRAFFPLPRFGHVTSNIAESANAWLLECRKRHPMRLFVKAIQKINVRFAERREKYANGNETDIVDDVFATIVTNTEAGRRLDVISASDDVFDVQSRPGSNASRTVNLLTMECSCKLFQDLGYPCPHACSALLHVIVDTGR